MYIYSFSKQLCDFFFFCVCMCLLIKLFFPCLKKITLSHPKDRMCSFCTCSSEYLETVIRAIFFPNDTRVPFMHARVISFDYSSYCENRSFPPNDRMPVFWVCSSDYTWLFLAWRESFTWSIFRMIFCDLLLFLQNA